MKKHILVAALVGLIVGVIVGLLLKAVPFIDNLVPDNLNSLITGGLAGGLAALSMGLGKSSPSE